jgi:hypothetical protein
MVITATVALKKTGHDWDLMAKLTMREEDKWRFLHHT